MPRRLPDALLLVAEQQDQVVSRAQLRAHGVGRDAVRWAVRAGRWCCDGPRVVRLTTGEPTRRQRAWAAVLHAAHGAALAGRTAAEFAGLRGWADGRIHVVVAKGVPTIPPRPGVVVHQSRRLTPADVLSAASPPRVRTARALVDAAAWTVSPRAAVGLIASGVQQRLVSARDLRATLDAAGRVRHVRLMTQSLDDIEGGSHALSELNLVAGCRRRGLPVPARQVVRIQDGRRRYLDALFVRADGTRVAVEIDGALHLLPGTWWDDLDRQNELVISGEPVLRFPSARLRTDPDRCFDQIARALAVRRVA